MKRMATTSHKLYESITSKRFQLLTSYTLFSSTVAVSFNVILLALAILGFRMIYEKETELREINSTQQRLREHMKALGKLDHDATEYIKSLSAAEDDLKKAEADIKVWKSLI